MIFLLSGRSEISKSSKFSIFMNFFDVIKDDDNILERANCPMHPFMFFQLSRVHNFNNANGKTYQEYVTIWRDRYTKQEK